MCGNDFIIGFLFELVCRIRFWKRSRLMILFVKSVKGKLCGECCGVLMLYDPFGV
ncbi:hypothetical protein Lalb_Chr21g0309511 [Lupinus albus]|uniref:Uncharacterized protein n=1 Tax=Lupinus albus TaxID=3870 RepID=A0A6A4NSB2_LUPAL|nr:hypothetical protein Lalb_Chr21g0309511 [Lupinus albus]